MAQAKQTTPRTRAAKKSTDTPVAERKPRAPRKPKPKPDETVGVTHVEVDGVVVAVTEHIDITPAPTHDEVIETMIEIVAPATVTPSFTVDAKAFTTEMALITAVTGNRVGSLPILSGVKITVDHESVALVATNLDQTVGSTIAATATIPGEFAVDASLLKSILTGLAGPTTITFDCEEAVTVVAGPYVAELRSLSVDDFPRLPDADTEWATRDVLTFRNAIKRTVPAASTDDARPILTSVMFDENAGSLRAVATDSYRLGCVTFEGVSPYLPTPVLVPSTGLKLADRLFRPTDDTFRLRFTQREMWVETGSRWMTCRLVEGEFPNYRQLIPDTFPTQIVVGRELLIGAIKRAAPLAKDATPIRMSVTDGFARLTIATMDVGNSAEPIKVEANGEIEFGFNDRYLLDGLGMFVGDEVVLNLTTPLKPLVITAAGEPGIYLQMPVRLP